MVFTSFGAQAQLTGDAAARAVVLTAAASLATRWMPEVGMLRSWGQPNANRTAQVIVDTLMNLELLFWAGNASGNATLTALARSHADRTAADFFQPWTVERGCCWHLVEYNDSTGALLFHTSRGGGLGADTVWTQGLAWAIAGFSIAYRYTGEAAYLAQSAAAADCFLAGLSATSGGGGPPLSGEPLWDFNASSATSPGLVVDSSVGAIAAAGLAELASHSTPPAARARYASAARGILASAAAHWAHAPGEDGGGATLRNGTLLPDVDGVGGALLAPRGDAPGGAVDRSSLAHCTERGEEKLRE